MCCQTSCTIPEGRRGVSVASAGHSWTLLRKATEDTAVFGFTTAPLPNLCGTDPEPGGAASLPVSPKGGAAPGEYSKSAPCEDVNSSGKRTHTAGVSQEVIVSKYRQPIW